MKKVKCVMLAAAMALSMAGCGGKGETGTIEEYGNLQEGVTEEGSESLSKEGTIAVTTESGEEKSDVAKRLGVDKIECNDSFEVSGKMVSIHVNSPLPEFGALPTYKVYKMTPDRLDVASIIKAVFQDGSRELSEEEALREELKEFSDEEVEGLLNGKPIEVYEGDNLVYRIEPIEDGENIGGEGHTYKGKYHGIDYVLSTFESQDGVSIVFYPDNPGEFIGEPALKYMNTYYPSKFDATDGYWTKDGYYVPNEHSYLGVDENGEEEYLTSENAMEYDIDENMKDRPNRCGKSDDTLKEEAEYFLSSTLGITMPSGTIDLYGNNEVYNDIDYEKSNIEQEFHKSELVFSEDNTFPKVNFNTAVRDGYEIGIMPKIAGLEPYAGSDTTEYAPEANYGFINITDEGVVSFSYTWVWDFEEELSPDSELLAFNNVIESFKEGVQENVMITDFSSESISFNDAYLTYVVISSPDGSGEMTYVPAWNFVGYVNGGEKKIFVYINAIDGSFISAEKPEY